MWLHGIPGAGKTILASFVIEQLQDLSKISFLPRGWCFYYCYHARNHDETTHFLRWVISQLSRQGSEISTASKALYQQGRDPDVSSLLMALEASLSMFESVFIVVDAVDESSNRENILETLRKLSSDSRFQKIQLLVTSRDEIDIRREFDDLSVSMSMSNPYVDDDIGIYVHVSLYSKSKNSKFRNWPHDLRHEVEGALVKGAKGM
jgi:Cdc6-like AAA superfamily ATPase